MCMLAFSTHISKAIFDHQHFLRNLSSTLKEINNKLATKTLNLAQHSTYTAHIIAKIIDQVITSYSW